MVAFPPGFPFVSRAPAPEPEPAPAASTPAPQPAAPTQWDSAAAPQPVVEPVPAAVHPPEQPAIEPKLAAPPVARLDRTATPPVPTRPPAVAAPVVKNDRRKVKRDGLATAALLRIDGLHGPPLKIELADISIAGARFRAPHRLDVGEKAQIRIEIGPFRWTTRLRVVHCSPADESGAATIGCAFLRTELLRPWPVAA